METRNQNVKGFTLIELLVYTVLLMVSVTIMTSFMVDTSRVAAFSMGRKEINQNARFINAKITQELKTARGITSVSSERLDYLNSASTSSYFLWDTSDKVLYFYDGVSTERLSDEKVDVSNINFSEDVSGVIKARMSLKAKRSSSSLGEEFELQTETDVFPRQSLY
ncbi:hypothetical protein C0584_04795 [Candidatus Parcubacteria bacterium]|nr:MAG: hypothetical protein C0584_04795 [Candidatus Parcubacteria bacterium]